MIDGITFFIFVSLSIITDPIPPCSSAHLVPADSLDFNFHPTFELPMKEKNAIISSFINISVIE